MTLLYIHRKFHEFHLTGRRYPGISEVNDLTVFVNQHQLVVLEHLVVVSVVNVSIRKPYAIYISATQH